MDRLADGAEVETVSLLQAPIRVTNQAVWDELRDLAKRAQSDDAALSVVDGDDIYDLLDDDVDFGAGRRLAVRVTKSFSPSLIRFFRLRNISIEMTRVPEVFENATTLKVADITSEVIQFVALEIVPWVDVSGPSEAEEFASPRTTVIDQTGQGVVPVSTGTWLVRGDSQALAIDFLGSVASYRLSLCLPSSLGNPEGLLKAVARAKSKVGGSVEPLDDDIWSSEELALALADAVSWVYAAPKEADNKHSLLLAEVVRLWPGELGWGMGLSICLGEALESARIAYRLYLYEKGADALKLMSDLRRSLADDVKAVSAHSGALSTGLWRDSALAFGAFALKGLGTLDDWAFLVLMVYLPISWYFTSRPADKSVASIKANEVVFRRRLYGALVFDKEYVELAGNSYNTSFSEFEGFKRAVGWVYVIVVVAIGIYLLTRNWALVETVWNVLHQDAGSSPPLDSSPPSPP